jgi:hypothetical protein
LSESSSTTTFSLYTGIQQASLSSPTKKKKKLKIRKIKFDIKIKFLKIKGMAYLIAKKDSGLN